MRPRVRTTTILRFACVVGAGLACVAFALSKVWPFTVDDSGIVYAYAKHVAHGDGFRAVVGGPTVEGYSDFLWMFLLAVVTAVGFDTPRAAKVLGAALFVCTAVAAAGFVDVATKRRRSPDEPRAFVPGWRHLLPVLLLASCPEFVVWVPSGLENSLFSASMLTAFWLDAYESERPSASPWSGVAVAAVALTRPEGAAYGVLIGLAKISDLIRSREHRRQFARFLSYSALPLLVYHAWHYLEFREILPNTYLAKAPGPDAWKKGTEYMKTGLTETAVRWLLPLGLASVFAGLRRTLPAIAATVTALYLGASAGGDWMPHFRFVSFSIPMIATLATVGLVVVLGAPGRLVKRRWLEAALTFAGAVALSAKWLPYQHARFDTLRWLKWCHFCSRVEDATNHQTERDRLHLSTASMLTHDFGGPSYASSASFFPLDLLGLADQPAALIEYQRRHAARDSEFERYQYFFHEQDVYPTFLYFPESFWRSLRATPEFLWGYADVALPRRRDGKIIAPTSVHRGEFVDFFPPVDRFVFQTIDARFALIGASLWSGRHGESEIEAVVSLQQRSVATERASLTLRVAGVAGTEVPLFGEAPALGDAFTSQEPLRVTLTVDPHRAIGPDDTVEVGVKRGPSEIEWVPLARPYALHSAAERAPALPFPNALPGTSDGSLMKLGRSLRQLVDRRRARADLTLADADLGRALVSAGAAAEARHDASDAYLAYVWASQADRDQVRLLYRKIAALRSGVDRRAFLLERPLLGAFYDSGDPFFQLQLVALYGRASLWDKARFFLERLPPTDPGSDDDLWQHEVSTLRAAVSKMDRSLVHLATTAIPGVTSDFEGQAVGWSSGGDGFAVVKEVDARRPFTGVGGRYYFSSEGSNGVTGRGSADASSAEFLVDARALTFLIAGGRSPDLTVELLVDGTVVAQARPPGSVYFTPVLWDLRPYRGKRAVVRLSDHCNWNGAFLAVDSFELWRYVEHERMRQP